MSPSAIWIARVDQLLNAKLSGHARLRHTRFHNALEMRTCGVDPPVCCVGLEIWLASTFRDVVYFGVQSDGVL